ncbi:MAG TPA: hypothetical protein VHM48_00795 [Candidatus Limnocylindrales bacterium]|nr:hypothetical protein [Candidatus Limnocylindrales bacterium]
MRVNRRFLYWGVFLVAIGGVLVAADLTTDDRGFILNALRLWPLAVVAIGLGLVLRRTRFSLPGGLLAAAVPGLVLGGAFAVAPHLAVDCGATGSPSSSATRQGSFDGPARISVSTGCGSLVVDTASGSAWRLDAGNAGSRSPIVDASAHSLSIDADGAEGWHVFDRTRDVWRLTVPTTAIDDLSLAVNAGTGRISLTGARIGTLDLTTNAAQASVDLTGATLATLTGVVNAGMTSIRLSETADVVGSMEVNAGSLQVCAPTGLGLSVHHSGALSGMQINGLHEAGANWHSPDYASAAHRADLNVTVNLGSVEINPIGGCK